MIFYILDNNFNQIDVIDDYESAIWTDRYIEPGDFELYILIGDTIPNNITIGRYLYCNESEHVMIIESIKIEADIEEGNKLIVTGRSLESILDRRIVWNKTIFDKDRYDPVPKTTPRYNNLDPYEEGWFEKSGNKYVATKDYEVNQSKTYYKNTVDLETAVKRLLTENIINPEISERKISNFQYKASGSDKIASMRLDAEYLGEDLLEVMKKICDTNKIGFKILLNIDTGIFTFGLYVGKDRSYDASTTGDYVLFSPKMDNYLNSNYQDDMTPHKNVTLCEGPEEDSYDRIEPKGSENPKEEGWYKWNDSENEYIPTEDTHVVEGEIYYELDGWEKQRLRTVAGDITKSGLGRREIYTDCSSASRHGNLTYDMIPRPYGDVNPKEEGWYKRVLEHGKYEYIKTQDEEAYDDNDYCSKNTHTRDDAQFKDVMAQMGKEKLSENKRKEEFDGEVDYNNGVFKYGTHYKIGDIVQIINEYGFSGKIRITEYVFSDNTSDGLKCYPKFETVEEEG